MQSTLRSGKGGQPAPRKESSLIQRNIRVGGHRTSIRLEQYFWDCLDDIAKREKLTKDQISTMVAFKFKLIDVPAHQGDPLDAIRKDADLHLFEGSPGEGTDPTKFPGTLTSAIRLFILAYYVRAATGLPQSQSGKDRRDQEDHITDIMNEVAATSMAKSDTRSKSDGYARQPDSGPDPDPLPV